MAEIAAVRQSWGVVAADGPELATTDRAVLLRLTTGASVIGLGEPGPGARELTHLYHAILRELVTNAGVTGLALDVDATTATNLDAYVRGQTTDVDAALVAVGDPSVLTVEMRALLQWLHVHNKHQREVSGPLVRVFGLDPGDPNQATAAVLAYLGRVDPQAVARVRSLLADGQQLALDAVLAEFAAKQTEYVALAGSEAFALAHQQVEWVAQALRMRETWEFEAGEFARARNVEWSLAQLGPKGRLVVWADNYRVAAEVPGPAPVMGNFLRQWLASGYRVVAGSIGGGQVLVLTAATPCIAAVPPITPGQFEAALAGPGQAITLVDLQRQPPASSLAVQQFRRVQTGRVTASRLRPGIAFDAIVHVSRVEPETPLARGQPLACQ